MKALNNIRLTRILCVLLLLFAAAGAHAQTYEVGSVNTNTTGSFTLGGDAYGLVTYIWVFKDGVRVGMLGPPPVALTNVMNGTYEYRYIWEWTLDLCIFGSCGGGPTYQYELGSVFVTVDYPGGIPTTAIAPWPSLSSSSVPGTLPLSTYVDVRGAFGMNIPVDVPPGINGLVPSVSLSPGLVLSFGNSYAPGTVEKNSQFFSSGGGALSSISYDSSGLFQPCYLCGVLTLNGEGALVSENPELTSPPVGQRYRVTRRPNILVIREQDSGGVAWFTVKRNGKIYRYGKTAQSRAIDTLGNVRTWNLEEVEDEFGNLLNVQYQQLLAAFPENVVPYVNPVLITYGGNRVEFVYNRLFNSPNSRVSLHTVRTRVNGVIASEYRLVHVPGIPPSPYQPAPPVLRAIQKCGFSIDGTNPTCTAPTTIDGSADSTYFTITNGLGVKTTASFQYRVYAPVFGANEVPFPMADSFLGGAFNWNDSEYAMVVTQVATDDGVGGVKVSNYAYRFAGINNDVVREQLADGTYLYTSYLPNFGTPFNAGPMYQNSDELSKQARYSGIAGTAGAKKLSYVENEYDLLTWDKHNGSRPDDTIKFLVLKKHKDHILDDYGNIIGGHYSNSDYSWNVATGALAQRVTTTVSGFDTSGVSIAANIQRTSVATTTYSNDLTNWIYAFTTSTGVETTVPGHVGSKGARTDYTPDSSRPTYKIGTATAYENDGSGLAYKSTTTTTYNQKGNPSYISVTGADFAARVTTFSNYLDDRYVGTVSQPTGTGFTLQKSFSYDRRFGSTRSVTDVNNGLTVSSVRDNLGETTQETAPNGTVTTTERVPCTSPQCSSMLGFDGRIPLFRVVVSVSHPYESYRGAPRQVSWYDSYGGVLRVETEGFSSSQWSAVDTYYNVLGVVVKRSLPYQISASESPRFVAYHYDARQRADLVTNPDGSTSAFSYQQLSDRYLVTKTDNIVRLGGTRTRVRVEEFDSLGKLRKSIDAFGSSDQVVTDYQYDQSGMADWVRVNGDDNTSVYSQYDASGRVRSVEDPNTGLVSVSYDGLGQLRDRIDADGVTSRFNYDLLGRMYQRIDDANGSNPVVNSWVFDTRKVGYLSSRSNPGFSEEYSYDGNGQVRQIDTVINVSAYSGSFSSAIVRDNYGRIKSETYPTGVVAETVYNTQGYANELRDMRTGALLSRVDAMNASGAVTTQSMGNGLVTSRTYDLTTGLLNSIQTGNGAVQNETYKWWSDGTLYQRSRLDTGATETFAYDNLGRLRNASTVTPSGTRSLSYTYDKLGNLMTNTGGQIGVSYNYEAVGKPHRLSGAIINGVVQSYEYDSKGNATYTNAPGVADDRRIAYDATGKTLSIVKGDVANPDAREEFRYDPDGSRYFNASLNKASGSPTTDRTIYLYQGAYELVLPGQGPISSIGKTYLGSVIHFRQVTSGVASERFEYVHTDHLGSVSAISDVNSGVVERRSFDPFGGIRSENWLGMASPPSIEAQQAHTNRGFTGHQQLYSTGLIHMNGRVYDPVLGRFLSADPLVQSPSLSQSYNRYAYVFNSPLSLTDPTGYMAGGGMDCSVMDRNVCDHIMEMHLLLRVDHLERIRGMIATSVFSPGMPNYPDQRVNYSNPWTDVVLDIGFRGKIGSAKAKDSGPSNGSPAAGNSRLGNILRRIPLFGGLLGAVGDMVSGVGNTGLGLITFGGSGTLGRGLSQLGSGSLSLADIVARDVFATVAGVTGTIYTTVRDVGNVVTFGYFDSGPLSAVTTLIGDALIPEYGNFGGPNWGLDTVGRNPAYILNQSDLAAFNHDYSLNHHAWISDQYSTSPEYQWVGPVGAAYGLLGTLPFAIAGWLKL